MEDFILSEAKQFAKIVHYGTTNFYKLSNLQNRLETELRPYTSLVNQLGFINEFEKVDILIQTEPPYRPN